MTTQQIKKSFGGKIVGTDSTKNLIAQTVGRLSENQINYATRHIWFFSTPKDTWAYAFHGNDLKDQHIIYLSDELLSEPREQIEYTILHELGHIFLNHKNSINFKQSKFEINQQELEADWFAKQFINFPQGD